MNYNNVNLKISAANISQLPESLPEIVFAGRSNVGKSSLINKLLNRKNFARISSSPGKTATINFYEIDETAYFTDLPGYGYANVSKAEKERWDKLIDGYFNEQRDICLVILLVDIRHKPSEYDKIMARWLIDSNLDFIVCLTKCDKLSKQMTENQIKIIGNELLITESTQIIPFSSKTGEGKQDIINIIESLIEDEL